jgi:hypothetical protein
MLRHGRRDVVGRGLPTSCTVQQFSICDLLPKNSLKNYQESGIFLSKHLIAFLEKKL